VHGQSVKVVSILNFSV